MLRPRAAAALAIAAVALVAGAASANGRFPAAGQIVVDPSDPAHIVVRATYGLLSSRDAGESFGWICEKAVGYGGVEDPAMAITAGGTVLAGVFEGLASSPDKGCSWAFAGGDLAGHFVVDVSTERADPSHAVLVFSNGVGTNLFKSQLWESLDAGGTWAQAGTDLPSDFLALTVDVAKDDPDRVYVSGRFGPPGYAGALMRSSDRGTTWERFDVPTSNDQRLPYIAAIDPSNQDVVYVRIDGDPDNELLVSTDGGQSFTQAFGGQGSLLAFALSPDGAEVLVGGDTAGLWRAPAATLEFQKLAELEAKCLHWSSAGLYACADEFVDGFTVGRSDDGGATWAPLMHLQDLCGPLECAAETSVGAVCGADWPVTKATLGAECAGSGATGSTSSSASTGGGDTSESGSGCGCRAAGEVEGERGAGARAAFAAALALALGSARRRRRRRGAR